MNNSAAKTWSVGPGVAATGPAGRHVKVPQKREHVSSSSSNPTFTIAASSSGATEAQPLALPQSSATKYQQSASAHIRSCSPSSSACRCHFRHTAADAPLGAVRGAYRYICLGGDSKLSLQCGHSKPLAHVQPSTPPKHAKNQTVISVKSNGNGILGFFFEERTAAQSRSFTTITATRPNS